MNRFRVHPLSRVTLREEGKAQVLSAELEAQVASIWQAECEVRGDALYDAPIFNVMHFGSNEIRGHFVPYRWWVAQLRRPELREILRVQPCSVCALSFVDEALLFGRRSPHATQDPGTWEPVPAGGIGIEAREAGGGLSAERQLQQELYEELGLPAERIGRAAPLALVVDLETRVHDIVFEVRIAATVDEVEMRFQQRPTLEVSEFCAVPRERLGDWMRARAVEMSPIAEVLVAAWEAASLREAKAGQDAKSARD